MLCAWKELLGILPQWMMEQVDEHRDSLQELRLRINAPPELVSASGSRWLREPVKREDISFCINGASRYSPWAASTVSRGYLTAPGGHRIGICGEVVCQDGKVSGIREISSLCIRIARDFPGAANNLPRQGNILVLGAPGWGKTTLLRDMIRLRSEKETVAVADERGELFPEGFARGKRMDVLTGASKAESLDRLLRTMGPDVIAVDEITAEEDCHGLLQAWGCGVKLLATAHAASLDDYWSRPVYQPLRKNHIFDCVAILHRDKSFRTERIKP